MRHLILVVFVLSLGAYQGFAQAEVQSIGTGPTQADAQQQALQALASQLKVTIVSEKASSVASTKDNVKEVYTSRSSARTDLTLLGVKFKSTQTASGWEVKATLDKTAAPLYQDKIATLTKSILADLALADAQKDTEDKISLYLSLQANLALREGYITVARQLGVKTFPKLDLTENTLQQKILAVEQANQQKLDMSVDALVKKASINSDFAEQIHSEIRSGLVAMNRFDVKESATASQSLKMTITKNEVQTFPGSKNTYSYCTAEVGLVLEIRDNKTKKMLVSKVVEADGSDSSSENRSYDVAVATRRAIDRLIPKALEALELSFVIQGRVVSIEPSGILVLSKGATVGIKQGMDFEIYDPADRVHQNKIAVLRISDVSANTSKGRVYKVVRPDLSYSAGFTVLESKTNNGFQAIVVKRTYSEVYLNVGKKMKVARGDYFSVVSGDDETLVDPITNLPIQTESSTHGRIQVTQVFDEYSIAKIEDGLFAIQVNDTVKQIPRGPWVLRASVSDTLAIFEVTENRNKTVTGLYYGTDSGGTLSESSSKYLVHMVQASFGVVDELWNYYTLLGLKYGNIASAPGVFCLDWKLGYELPLVPGYVGAFAEGTLGVAFAGQSAGYVSSGSITKAPSDATSVGLDLEAKLGLSLSIHGFALKPSLGFTSLSLNKWKYDPDPNSSDSDLKETSIVRYPKIQASPLTFSVSAEYTF